MKDMIAGELRLHQKTIENTLQTMIEPIDEAISMVVETLQNGGKILICGNGGSAADAQHIAAELTGRYKSERRGLPAIALSTDTSAITAISNDYGYERVFARQVEALADSRDLLLGISTSGNSPNIVAALKQAGEIGCKRLGFSGTDGGKISAFCDLNLIVPSNDTPRIQEVHILVGHILCQAVDDVFILP